MSIEKNSRTPRVRRSPEASRENILIAAEGLLVKQGFAQAMLHQPTDFARDLQLDDDPSHRLVRIVQAKT